MFKIEELPKTRIAYMRQVGPYGESNKILMEKFKNWATLNELMHDDAILFGIVQDNPTTTPPQNCRYDVCIVISEEFQITDGAVSEAEFPGGKFAVFTVNHTEADLQRAWLEIFPELSAQKYQINPNKPVLERYIPRMIQSHLCEICVPVY